MTSIDTTYANLLLLTSLGQYIDKFGGYYVGNITVNKKLYALIVSPKELGETKLQFKISNTPDINIQSRIDGWTNTNNMNDSEHPAAQWTRSLSINSFNDWYIPSIDELKLLYANVIKSFTATYYWSSSENPSDTYNAFGQYFFNGYQGSYHKNFSTYVRAVRRLAL